MNLIETLGYKAAWSPYFLVVLLTIYLLIVTVYKGKIEKLYFGLSIILIYIVKGSPVDLYSHFLFSVHMTQMAILFLVIPPVILYSFRNFDILKTINKYNKPILSLFLFNGVFSIYHFPIVFDYVKSNVYLHSLTNIFIFILAILMWFPIVIEKSGLSQMQKIGYIFANGVLITPACALIIFSNHTLYDTYTTMGGVMNSLQLCIPASAFDTIDSNFIDRILTMSKLYDQQLGGVIMKILQELIYGFSIGFVFLEWLKAERENVY
ncbi:MAG: ctaG [Bacillales bacterium]|jgi:putative membrane protein|nr:ctaG [Bacillales bacterium]